MFSADLVIGPLFVLVNVLAALTYLGPGENKLQPPPTLGS